MKDHHNVFFYYRGAPQSEVERDRQLENNTTKALINTLELAEPSVRRAFMEWLGIRAVEPIDLELQLPTIGHARMTSSSQRLLLGLVPPWADSEPKTTQDCSDVSVPTSLPDAWIYGPGFAVLIESKVAGGLDAVQWQEHRCRLTTDSQDPPQTLVRTWPEVHGFFRQLPQDLSASGIALDVRSLFLLGQFTRYLGLIGMSKFAGIDLELLDCFSRRDEDTKARVRGVITALAEEVLTGLHRSLGKEFYQDFQVGNLWREDDHTWAAFGPKANGYRHVAHQTIALNANGVDVFVNVELARAARRLAARIAQDRTGFRSLVKSLLPGESFWIEVQERRPKPDRPRIFDYFPVARRDSTTLRAAEVGPEAFETIESEVERLRLPYFTVTKRIDRDGVARLSANNGRPLVDEIRG